MTVKLAIMARNIVNAKVTEAKGYVAEKLRSNRERWSKLGERTRALQERLNGIEQKLWSRPAGAF